ncbi:MAG: LWR-salt protein [Halanaeroarchaeum sp.]
MAARYVFGLTFGLETGPDVSLEPNRFETRLIERAVPPGEPGWLFFRDNLWRGAIADPEHFRSSVEEALDVVVASVDYRAFETDEDTLEAFREAIADDLSAFNDDSVDAVLNKYLGASIEVV